MISHLSICDILMFDKLSSNSEVIIMDLSRIILQPFLVNMLHLPVVDSHLMSLSSSNAQLRPPKLWRPSNISIYPRGTSDSEYAAINLTGYHPQLGEKAQGFLTQSLQRILIIPANKKTLWVSQIPICPPPKHE